jgi:acyl-CoA synthetase (AMP-forming)/AMP-acid ligase II
LDVTIPLEGFPGYKKGRRRSKEAPLPQLPERTEFIEDIPLTKVGKADKGVLREEIKKRLGLAVIE